IELPEPPAGRGKAAAPVREPARWIGEQPPGRFTPIREPVLAAMGVHLACAESVPALVRLVGTDRAPEVTLAREADDTRAIEGREVVIDLERGGGRAVVRSVQGASELRWEGGGLRVAPIYPPLPVTAPPSVPSEIDRTLEHWLETEGASDPWLAGRVREERALGGVWPRIVALGLLARFRQPSRDSELRALTVQRLLRGERIESLCVEREAFREAGAPLQRFVEDCAAAVAASLYSELVELDQAEEDEFGGPAWRRALASVLRQRNDLEGPALLLRSANHAGRLDPVLAALDEEGELLMRSLEQSLWPEPEEALRRAAQVHPEAWWSWPALFEGDDPGHEDV
ncbi:MAG: hypothetical protein D6776_10500, partial [Planctomycetota bacterium]